MDYGMVKVLSLGRQVQCILVHSRMISFMVKEPKQILTATNMLAISSGKFNGKGTFSWADGTKYVGSFSDGERHGIGTSTWGRRGKYVGEWKKGKAHGLGITRDEYGKISEGAFKEGNFLYATKTPYSLNAGVSSQLKNAFVKLSKSQRKQIQSNLKDLGYYKSSIDGLYGKGTSGALTAYNKQNLNGADLNNFENVNNLISAVLD